MATLVRCFKTGAIPLGPPYLWPELLSGFSQHSHRKNSPPGFSGNTALQFHLKTTGAYQLPTEPSGTDEDRATTPQHRDGTIPHNPTIFPLQGTFPMDCYAGEQYTCGNVVPPEKYPQDVVHGLSPGDPYGVQENSPFSASETNSYCLNSEESYSPISMEDAYFPVLQSRIGNDIGILSPERIRTHGAYTDRSGSSPGMSTSDEISYSPGQGYATDSLQLQPGYGQPLDQYHLFGPSHAQPLMGQLMGDSMNGEFEYLLFRGGPSPTAMSYPGDREPYGHSPDDTNESLSPLNGRTHASDPETDARTSHQPNLNIGRMEINTPCSPIDDRQSLTERSVTEEGHVSPISGPPQPVGGNLAPRTEPAHRTGTRAIDRSHPWYSRQPDSDRYYRCPTSDCEGKYKQYCHYKKHIDKHLKPHRCRHRECEGSSFASAGGALRHEREAHGMHAPRKYPCSFEGCDRGKNNPFHRNWNLGDHLKRVHNIQPGQYGQRGQRSQHGPQDQHSRNPTADMVLTASRSSSIRECVPDDNSGYSPALLQKEDEGGEEGEEGEAPRFQEGPRQNQEPWSTAGYPSKKVALPALEPAVQGSLVQGPGVIEQINTGWASLRRSYQQVLDSPSDLSVIKSFQTECFNMYKITKRIVRREEEGEYSHSG
ncbi:MAG: hypothetical protein M1840_005428 [Geoglossum simile]|nr:MAG: hypothetical protein M1840_005428 [Geoglossum simile]